MAASMMGLAGQERSLTISLPVWMHNTNMTHGQTAVVVPHIHIALCGKTRQIHYRLKVRLMQSFKRCVVHSCFGCRELVPCGGIAILVDVLWYKKYHYPHGSSTEKIAQRWRGGTTNRFYTVLLRLRATCVNSHGPLNFMCPVRCSLYKKFLQCKLPHIPASQCRLSVFFLTVFEMNARMDLKLLLCM